jgi:hypothetical protein
VELPDIYYIILDAHACPSTLSQYYDYDVGPFVEALKEKGFFVADRSCSNYAMTTLSLASSLNMQHVHSPGIRKSLQEKGVVLLKRMIEDNAVMRYVIALGYQVMFMGSGFGVTQRSHLANCEIRCGYLDETRTRFVQSSLLRAAADKTKFILADKRNRVQRMLAELGKIHAVKGPKFVFAHVPSPQWPFLFDSEGRAAVVDKKDAGWLKKAYVEQLAFVDGRIMEVVEQILAGSQRVPIIILQADHGPNFAFPGKYGLQHPPKEVLLEKMRIFTAIYLPGSDAGFLYASISPVNIFRLIFNHYYGSTFTSLDDQSYFSTLESPHVLKNVTDLLYNA